MNAANHYGICIPILQSCTTCTCTPELKVWGLRGRKFGGSAVLVGREEADKLITWALEPPRICQRGSFCHTRIEVWPEKWMLVAGGGVC